MNLSLMLKSNVLEEEKINANQIFDYTNDLLKCYLHFRTYPAHIPTFSIKGKLGTLYTFIQGNTVLNSSQVNHLSMYVDKNNLALIFFRFKRDYCNLQRMPTFFLPHFIKIL